MCPAITILAPHDLHQFFSTKLAQQNIGPISSDPQSHQTINALVPKSSSFSFKQHWNKFNIFGTPTDHSSLIESSALEDTSNKIKIPALTASPASNLIEGAAAMSESFINRVGRIKNKLFTHAAKTKIDPPTELENKYAHTFDKHFADLETLVSQIQNTKTGDIPTLFTSIQKLIIDQTQIYTDLVHLHSDEIRNIRATPLTDDIQRAKLFEWIANRNFILRAFQKDVAILDGLMEFWHIRQIPDSHSFLKETEDKYYNLEDNKIKLIPMYGVNFSNSVCSVMGALVMLSIFNVSLPFLFHNIAPNLIPYVDNPHAHMNTGAITDFLKQISIFGLSFDAIYGGYKGMRCRNTNATFAKKWNKVLDTAGLIFKPITPGFDYLNRGAQSLIGKPWQYATRYAYRATSLGAMGIVRQFGRDITLTPNDAVTWGVRKFIKDAPSIRPFGNIGNVSIGLLIGGLFDWSVGVIENVMQNIIVKMPGNSLTSKVGIALQDPFSLLWQNAAPSGACNILHANATARVTQYPGNDDMDVVLSRFGLGVVKGSLLTAIISTAAINGNVVGATALYLGAQVLIGSNSILISKAMTNTHIRQRSSDFFAKFKNR